jgi:outer membrane efflux protein
MNQRVHRLLLLEISLLFSGTLLVRHADTAFSQDLQPAFWITLEETIQHAVADNDGASEHSASWKAADTRMEDLSLRGGWEVEVAGRADRTGGDRRETRDDSLGSSVRDKRASLDEDEKFLELALSKEFLDEPRQNKDDIADERVTQLARAGPWFSALNAAAREAAEAYLDVYYGKHVEDLTLQQIQHQEEALRVLKEQMAQEEALGLDILETESSLAELGKKLLAIRTKNERQIGALRECWGMADLVQEDLAKPEIREASNIEASGLEELVQQAFLCRPDIRASQAALAVHTGARGLTQSRPEVELIVSGRLGDFDRDFADEGREDSTYNARAEVKFTYPLSMRSRNALKLRRHSLQNSAMASSLAALRKEVKEKVTESYDTLRLDTEEVRIQRIEVDKAKEQERIARLKAETMPEMLGANPEFAIRAAEIRVLASKVKVLEAERERTQTLVELLATTGKLVPTPAPLAGAGPSMRN